MKNFSNIEHKLNGFVKKYYTNELIKGAILFFSIGVLYFLFTLLVEHFLWLSIELRTVLFWAFILVEIGLLIKFIGLPLAKLFNLKKGINYDDASKLIGAHFPEVNDKLLNVLQLNKTSNQSELLLASIDQKSSELSPIPFKKAVNYKTNAKYLKYALIPVGIVLAIFLSGKINWFSSSYERVVNYNMAYEPPAPFKFYVLNDDLKSVENKAFTIMVETVGTIIPENASISFNDETYFLKTKAAGQFEYTFKQITKPISFRLKANNIVSKPYTINVVNAPQIISFEMLLDYPNYTGNKDETLKSIGNAVIPQGTKVTWKVNSKHTNAVFIYSKDTLQLDAKTTNRFEGSKRLFNSYSYHLSTSNEALKNYENLAFNLKVIKDQDPTINVAVKKDSIDQQSLYFFGKVSDDYGLTKLQLVYYPLNEEVKQKHKTIEIPKGNFTEFIKSFPNELSVEDGKTYELYFQVFDNDLTSKSSKSSVFTYRKRTISEEENKLLDDQNKSIKDLGQSLNQLDKQEKELENLSKAQKEKSELNFNDKKKLDQFLKRQKEQKKLMEDFNKKLQENLKEFNKQNKDQPKDHQAKDLEKRLKENEEALKKDEKILKELEELKKKFDKEKFTEKLDELAAKAKSKKKSLEQILELTKRYYVKKKFEKIGEEIDELGKKQSELAKKDKKNTKSAQDRLNNQFKAITKKLDAVAKDNKQLKKPLKLQRNLNTEENVKDDQKCASNELNKEQEGTNAEEKKASKTKAKKKQQSAAQQLKKMSMQMKSASSQSGQEQLEEDAKMLRQILDNLVIFSLSEEDVMERFRKMTVDHSQYSKYLKKQHELKSNFEHIDDSLFALSTRNPKLSEQVNTEIGAVYFNIEKALTQFADNRVYSGVAAQQYAVTSSNNLANLLSDTLENMQNQMSMPSPGKGEGDMPLPDIIISQEALNKKMEEALKKGDKGEQGKEGEKGKDGENGKKGDEGKDGQSGDQGKSGSEGKEGQQGKSGENGKQGNGKGSKGKGQEGKDGNNASSSSKGKNGKNGRDKGGKKGDGNSNNGFLDEQQNGEIFKIYQQQQRLREALDQRLEKQGLKQQSDAARMLRQMEQAELGILNHGITKKTLSKMRSIKHQLIKLDHAILQQGEDKKRKSDTNKKVFENTSNNIIEKAKSYFNTTEILNKQNLPLQPVYKQKVQQYFNHKND